MASEKSKTFHLVGVGGVGMAALAWLLKRAGNTVTGCDIKRSARTRWLEENGIKVFCGHDKSHVEGVDEVVLSSAVSRDNPELAAGKTSMRGEVLAKIVSECDSVAVCGTHGKTTTSTWTAKLLAALGEHVVWAVGGETGSFRCAGEANAAAAAPPVLVVEADESDGTLAQYRAGMLVVTNCEFDHPEHFSGFAAYKACFDAARAKAREIVEVQSLEPFPAPDGGLFASLAPHNAKNARAAAEVAIHRGHSPRDVILALAHIVRDLPDRRFEYIYHGEHDVIADYAHHPTEIAAAIGMAHAVCKGRLRVLFQPHRHSRTKVLLKDFPDAFALADETIICPVYAAFSPDEEGGSAADLYAECRSRNVKGLSLARSCREAWRHAFLEHRDGDVTLLLGAGDIIDLAAVCRRDLAGPRPQHAFKPLRGLSFFGTGGKTAGGGAKRFAGAGSNLWISDLTTDEEYVFAPRIPSGPAVFGGGVSGAALGVPWMAGVPGTVGGWVKMNAGAFGHSISELVVRVKAGGRWLENAECAFAYRSSAINGQVEEAMFDLSRLAGDPKEFLARRPRFPPRCCGSVFKNPPGESAGRLLESVGAKGMSVGGAYVWEGHANVIAVRDGAMSSDVLALAQLLRERVQLRLGVALEYEIAGLGELP